MKFGVPGTGAAVGAVLTVGSGAGLDGGGVVADAVGTGVAVAGGGDGFAVVGEGVGVAAAKAAPAAPRVITVTAAAIETLTRVDRADSDRG